MKKSFVVTALSGLFLLSASNVHASGFGLKFNSAQLAGQSYAGSAVSADPLAAFNNPAATILSKSHEAALQVTALRPKTHFHSDTGQDSKQAARSFTLPSGAFTAKINNCWRFNINYHVPYGLKYDYGNNVLPTNLRNYVTKADLRTENINLNIAYRANDVLTFGFGLNILRAKLDLNNTMGTVFVSGAPDNILSEVKGHDHGYGFTVGFLLEPTKDLKVGLSYRSHIKTTLKGNIKYTPEFPFFGDGFTNRDVNTKLTFPSAVTFSASYDLTPKWTLLGDLIDTRWHTIDSLRTVDNQGRVKKETVLEWKDRVLASFGVNFKPNEAWVFRAGFAYDKTPTVDGKRIPAIPDTNRTWLSAGATYNFTPKSSLTLSVGHESFRKGRIDLLQTTGENNFGPLNGHVKTHATHVGIQFNHKL